MQGGLVGNVALVVKPSKTYLTLPYYNNLKTVGTYITAKDFDFEKAEATICVKAEVRNEDVSRRGAEAQRFKIKIEVREAGTAGTAGTTGTTGTATQVTAGHMTAQAATGGMTMIGIMTTNLTIMISENSWA